MPSHSRNWISELGEKMPQHTPAPWWFDPQTGRVMAGTGQLARPVGYAACGRPGAIANGHLFAKAPELLDVVAGFIRAIDNRDGEYDADPGCDECTHGTTPHDLRKGPCPYHRGKALLRLLMPVAVATDERAEAEG